MAGQQRLVSPSSRQVSSGGRSKAPGSCSCVCWLGHHNPAPSSQASWGGGKTCGGGCQSQGFSLFPGTAGKCSLPWAGSPASGAGEGSGMPSAESESILQDPGEQDCLGSSSMGRAIRVECQ